MQEAAIIDAYEIGVRLVLDDKIIGSLGTVQDNFKLVEDAVARTNSLLSETVSLMSSVSASARGMASSWQAAAAAAERMATAASGIHPGGAGGGGGFVPPAGGGYLPFQPDEPQVPRLDYAGGSLGQLTVMPGQGRYTPGDGSYAPGAGEDAPFNPRPMPPLDMGGGSKGFDPMHAMSYGFMAYAGAEIVGSAVSGLMSPGMDVQTQLNQIRMMTPADKDGSTAANQALAAARAIHNDPSMGGISIGDALGMVTNFYSVDRNMGEVAQLSRRYALDNYVISNRTQDYKDKLYPALRAGEDAGYFNGKDGRIDPTRELQFLETAASLNVSSNGAITPDSLMVMVGQIGAGASQMSPAAMERAMIQQQALGGSQTGTGLNAMYQEFIGGKMSQATAMSLHKEGLLPDYMFGQNGKPLKKYENGIGNVSIPTGGLKDEAEALADPVRWSETHIFGKYFDSNGMLRPGEANAEGFIADVSKNYSRIPGGKVAANAMINDAVQTRLEANTAAMPSIAQIAASDSKTLAAQTKATGAAWDAFLVAIGSPLIPGATKGLNMLAGALNTLAGVIPEHPIAAIDTEVAIAAGAMGLLLKGASGIKPLGAVGRAAGAVADGGAGLAGDVMGGPFAPLLLAMQYMMTHKDPLAAPGAYGRYGAHPAMPSGDAADPLHVVVTNGVPLVSPSPTMPTGPTAPNSALTPRNPGAVNRLTGHQ